MAVAVGVSAVAVERAVVGFVSGLSVEGLGVATATQAMTAKIRNQIKERKKR